MRAARALRELPDDNVRQHLPSALDMITAFTRRALTVALTTLVASGCSPRDDDASPPALRIALFPVDERGAAREFELGAQASAEEFDVDISWRGAFGNGDAAQQASLVRQAANEPDLDGLIVVSNGARELGPALAAVQRRGLPFVLVGAALPDIEPYIEPVTHVWHDPYDIGRAAAEDIATRLRGRGTVALLRQAGRSTITTAYEQAFVETLAEHPGIEIVVDEALEGEMLAAARSADQLLHRLRDVDAIFASAPGTAHGVLVAQRRAELMGHALLVSVGLTSHLLDALPTRGVTSLIIDDPRRLADHAVRALVSNSRGHPVPATTPVPPIVLSRENFSDYANRLVGR